MFKAIGFVILLFNSSYLLAGSGFVSTEISCKASADTAFLLKPGPKVKKVVFDEYPNAETFKYMGDSIFKYTNFAYNKSTEAISQARLNAYSFRKERNFLIEIKDYRVMQRLLSVLSQQIQIHQSKEEKEEFFIGHFQPMMDTLLLSMLGTFLYFMNSAPEAHPMLNYVNGLLAVVGMAPAASLGKAILGLSEPSRLSELARLQEQIKGDELVEYGHGEKSPTFFHLGNSFSLDAAAYRQVLKAIYTLRARFAEVELDELDMENILNKSATGTPVSFDLYYRNSGETFESPTMYFGIRL